MSDRAEKQTLFVHKPHSHKPRNVNEIHAEERARGANAYTRFNERAANWTSWLFSTMEMFWLMDLFIVIWMVGNSIGIWHFDLMPFPLLLFIINIPQLPLLPLLAISGKVIERKQELMAEEQFHTSQKTFQDVETLIRQNNQQLELLEIHRELLENHYKELSKHTDLLTQTQKPFAPRRRPMKSEAQE